MTGENRRKIQAVLLIAMLAGAEAQQIGQAVRLRSAHGLSRSASSTKQAPDEKDVHNIFGGQDAAAKHLQEVTHMIAQQAKTMMANPDFKRQAMLVADQLQAMMPQEQMKAGMGETSLQHKATAFAEQREALMANPDFRQQAKAFAEQMAATVADPNLVGQANKVMIAGSSLQHESKHGSEQMKAIMANVNFQERMQQLSGQVVTDPNSLAKTTRFAELFQVFMADPIVQRQTKRMREQVGSMIVNTEFQEQARLVAEQMKALMTDPGSPGQLKRVAEQMETIMADLNMQAEAGHAAKEMEAMMMADPNSQKNLEFIAEEIEAMHTDPKQMKEKRLADHMVNNLLDRSLKEEKRRSSIELRVMEKEKKGGKKPITKRSSVDLLAEDKAAAKGEQVSKEGGSRGAGKEAFNYNSEGLSSEEAERLLKIHGLNQLPEKKIPKWKILLNLLITPMPLMIFAAAAIEASISNFPDMGILLFINFANACIGFYETTKAADAVEALKKSLKPKATVKRDGKWQVIDGTLVVPGDMVLLASGSAMPADCRVNVKEREPGSDIPVSQIDVDQAALTGESLPVTLYEGDKTLMGSTVVHGEVEGTVEFTGSNTFFGKTAALLGGTEELSHVQYLLISIVRSLTILSLVMCLAVMIYVWSPWKADHVPFKEALSYVVVLMVASIPMAMEIVTTTTLALGSKELTKHGAIVTRLAAIEDMAGMAILCSDKTGTLTLNEMKLQEYTPVYSPGVTQYSLLRFAAMAAKWKEPARDALDKLVLGDEKNPNGVDLKSMECIEQLDFMPFNPVIKRTQGTVRDKSKEINGGKVFKTSKGAPHVILKLVEEAGGLDKDLKAQIEKDVHDLGERGIRAIAVAKTDESGKWKMMGLLTFLDPPRPDTKETVRLANLNGVKVKMITGDHLLIAKETSRALDMGDIIQSSECLPLLDEETKAKPDNLGRDYGDRFLAADGFAQVYPEHKYLIVEGLRELGYRVGMTGDGVNDSPALKRADVGIAVYGSTDAAKAAADIVLTEAGLSTIVEGILIARRIWCRIRSFLTYRISATLQLLCFFFISAFLFHPNKFMPEGWATDPSFPDTHEWPQFFHMPVLMLMFITLLNDGTLITIGYDHAVAPQTPPIWNLPFLFSSAFVQSFVAMISSLNLLSILLHSWEPGSVMRRIGLGGISYGKITSSIYLKVAVSDLLTLFSARSGGDWFFKVKPAPVLLIGALLALASSTAAAMFWPKSYPDGIQTEGLVKSAPYLLELFVWGWSLGWWVIQDAAKVFFAWLAYKFNFFHINDSGVMKLTDKAKEIQQEIRQSR